MAGSFALQAVVLALPAVAAGAFTLMLDRRMRALRVHVTTSAAPRGEISLQLAGGRAAVVAILRSWDHQIAGRGERAIDVALTLLDLDAIYIKRYGTTFACAGLAPIVGLGRAWPGAWLWLACAAWFLAVAAMGRADTIENAQMTELLRAGPDGVQAGHHDAAIVRMNTAARVKFTLLAVESIAVVALWVAFVRAR